MDFKKDIIAYYELMKKTIDELNVDELNEAMNVIYKHYLDGSTIYTLGNGGSSATASHMVCDFNKGTCLELDKKFNLVCLNDNIPIMMAISNDIGFEDIFYEQIKNKVKKGDLLLAISGSGNSKNVIKACEYAKKQGAEIIGITGYQGGKLKEISNYHMHVNLNNMQIVEDIHMSFDHMMMTIFYHYLNQK